MDVDELIELLPEGLWDGDPETVRILRAWLEPVARVQSYYDLRTERLGQLLDPSEIPDELVPLLARQVGLSPDLAAVQRTPTAQLRALIPEAARLWRTRGTRGSWRALVAALTGSRAVVLDWFELRTVHGSRARVAVIPGPESSDGYPYAHPERVSDLWIADPEGAIDLELLAAWLELARPTAERVNVYPAWFVDDLGSGADLWASDGAGSGSWDPEAWSLTAVDSRAYVADLGGLEAAWTDYGARLRLAVTGGAELEAYRSADGATCYRVAVDQAAGTVTLARVVEGVATELATAAVRLAAEVPYLWALEVWEGTAATVIRVSWEGAVVLEATDADATRPSSGAVAWRAVADATATLSTALVWPARMTPIRIGPTT